MVALMGGSALSAPLDMAGDGSDANNPDLLRAGFSDCPNCEGTDVPQDWNSPLFDVDWTLGLRGSYVTRSSGTSYYGASVLPSVAVTHQGLRTAFGVSASAELVQTNTDDFRIAALGASGSGEYRLDEVSTVGAIVNLSLGQAEANPPSIEKAEQVLTGTAQATLRRDMGMFRVALGGNLGRVTYGPRTGAGGVLIDNSWRSNTEVGSGLRLSLPVSPVLAVFVEGNAGYQLYDAPAPTIMAKLDGYNYSVKTGLSYAVEELISGEVSIGKGLRRYDAGFADSVATLYNASVTFSPGETVSLNATLSAAIDDPGPTSGNNAQMSASLEGSYKLNPWLTTRAMAAWSYADVIGATAVESGYSVGVGADYAINQNTTLNADYGFGHFEAPPSAPTDTHRVTVGVTFSK